MTKFAGAVWAALRGKRSTARHHGMKDEYIMATVAKLPPRGPDAGTVHWLNECIAKSASTIVSAVSTVTPGLAAELLRRNEGNRHIRPVKADQYASDMAAGRWAFNGEPIILSSDGQLNDGQHRLQAVIDANVSLPMLFVFGVDRSTRLTVDQGSARSAGDFLGMEGVEHANIAASVARIIISYEVNEGKRIYREGDVTNAQIRARVVNDPEIGKAAAYAASVYKYTRQFVPPAVVGAAFYLLSGVNPIEARDYMDRVSIGESLRRGDPAYAVRDALIAMGRGRGGKLEVIFRGWVKYRSRQPLKLAKVMGTLPALV